MWQALQTIPAGTTVSYAEIARRIGAPSAVRAVAGSCAANNLAVAIPCHRVVRTDGSLPTGTAIAGACHTSFGLRGGGRRRRRERRRFHAQNFHSTRGLRSDFTRRRRGAAEIEEIERRHRHAVQTVESEGLTPDMRNELETLEELLHNAIIASLRNPLIEASYRRIGSFVFGFFKA